MDCGTILLKLKHTTPMVKCQNSPEKKGSVSIVDEILCAVLLLCVLHFTLEIYINFQDIHIMLLVYSNVKSWLLQNIKRVQKQLCFI
jgi:hypothetical protein